MELIIFLDIDGCIATYKSYKEYSDRNDLLDRCCMQALNYLCKTLEAKVVISSTWRMEGLETLRKKFEYAGFKGEIIGLTPNLINEKLDARRGTEILRWIEQNNYKDEYIVIDDEVCDIKNDIPSFRIHHIENGFRKQGLTIERADKIVKFVRENTPTEFHFEDYEKYEKERQEKYNSELGVWYRIWDFLVGFYYSLNRIYPLAEIKYAIQRIKRGYSDRDTWGFDYYLSEVIADGLKRIKEDKLGYPCSFESEDEKGPQMIRRAISNWQHTLDHIIWAFETAKKIQDSDVYIPWEGENAREREKEFISRIHHDARFLEPWEYEKMKEGFRLFGEHFFSFWD